MRRKKESKKRSAATALLCRRKKFSTVFWQRWILVFVILTLVYVIGVTFFANYKKGEKKRDYYWAQGKQVEYFVSLAKKYEGQQLVNRVALRLTMMADTHDYFAVLCDEETKEVITGCEEKLFFIRNSGGEEETTILVCDLDTIPGWKIYRQKLKEHDGGLVRLYESVKIPEIYTNDGFFVPKTMEIEVTSIGVIRGILLQDYTEEQVFCQEIEYAETIPEGYTEEDITGYVLKNPIILGYSPDSPYMNKDDCSDASYKLLWEYYEERKTNAESSSNWEQESLFGIHIVSDTELDLGLERPVSLLSVAYYDVVEVYGGLLAWIAIVVLLISVLIAYLLARVSYARMQARYDVEDYRRNLMNTMAHDLKSPLMSISGYAENLRDNLHSEKQAYYSEAILNNVQYMNGIIESVLYLSKMEEGKLSLKKELLHARAVVEKLVAEREESLQERELKVEMVGDVVLEADATLLEQLLCNLLDNAVKYASNNTTICVMMKDKEISIQNVCEEDLSSVEHTLCQPFVVGDTSRSNQKGSGLGLAIARNICELHGFGFDIICKEKSFEAKIKG